MKYSIVNKNSGQGKSFSPRKEFGGSKNNKINFVSDIGS